MTVSDDKTTATWTGNIEPRREAYIKRVVDGENKLWVTIHILNEDEEWFDEN